VSQRFVGADVKTFAPQPKLTVVRHEEDEDVVGHPRGIERFEHPTDRLVERRHDRRVALLGVGFVRGQSVGLECPVRCLPDVRLTRFLVPRSGKVRGVECR